MKLYSLTISNIASLRGKHYIDFDDITKASPIFAITGDTGAGKSTLLNCISLALYGKHYKKNIVHNDMVTLGETKGRVELIFSISNNFYKACFESTIRKSNGEFLKKPKSIREFYSLQNNQEEIIDDFPQSVINLNYEQFCKTIILNQGMFAQFLTSDFRERKEIINKLYQSDYLEHLNPKLREKINLTVRNKEIISAKLNAITQNDINVTKADYDKSKAEYLINEKRLKNLTDLDLKLTELLKLKSTYDQTLKKIETNKDELKSTIESVNQIKTSLKDSELKLNDTKLNFDKNYPLLINAVQKIDENKNLLVKKENLANEVEKLSSELKEKKQIINKLTISIKAEQEIIKELNLSDKLDRSKLLEYKELQNGFEKLNFTYNHLLKVKKDLTERLDILKQEINQNTQKHQTLKDKKDSLVSELKDYDFTTSEQKLQKINALREFQKTITAQQKKLSQERELSEKLLAKEEKQNTDLIQASLVLDKELKTLEKLYSKNKLDNAKHLLHLKSIEDGKCYVCGTKYDQEFLIDENDLLIFQTQIDQKREDAKNHELKKKLIESKILQYKKEIQKNNEHSTDLSNQYTSRFLEIFQRSKVNNSLQFIDNELNSSQKEHQLKLEAQKELSTLDKLIEQDLLQQTKTTKTFNKTQEDLDRTLNEVAENEMSINQLKRQLPLPLEIFMESIKSLERYQLIDKKISAYTQDKSQNELKLSYLQDLHGNKLLELAQNEKQVIENINFIKDITDNDPKDEIEKLQNKIKSQTEKRDQLQKDLKEHSDSKINLESKERMFKEQLIDCENLFSQTVSYFQQKILIAPWSEFNLSALNIEIDNLILDTLKLKANHALEDQKVKSQKTTRDFHEISALHEQQKKKEEQISTFKSELIKIQKNLDQWEELYQLIGKDEFRNFILSIVEKNLITQTNYELEKICDARYQLKQINKNNNISDFYVIDQYNGNELRKVSTLSGGETFMVSLAMSLALSDMTRGQAQIDSFFIDEGFGTLDQDSLDDVYIMLNDINQRGKQIGLISHVKELTNRIPININLSKNRLGNSTVSVLSN